MPERLCCSRAVSRADVRQTIATVWKEEAPKLIGSLTRVVRDLGLAEELAHDAFVAALEEWPLSGVPERPGAWLMTTAKNRALNRIRHRRVVERSHAHTKSSLFPCDFDEIEARLEVGLDEDVADDVLRLMFAACHPVLSKEARAALTLRLVGGLSTDEIARAFLTTEPTVAQRIVRAKRTLAEAAVTFEVPRGDELGRRIASVLEVIYLVFNEGYSATAGDDVLRPALVDEALRLAALAAELAPNEPEAHGLRALVLLQSSRSDARTDARGEPILLADQDRGRWDHARIETGLRALDAAEALAAEGGPYQIQAAIAACHARAATFDATDWAKISALYTRLGTIAPSPVVELNRALAVSRSLGPAAGLVILDALREHPALARYHLLPSARADLLEKLGRLPEARAELERAAALTENVRLRDRLLERAARCK